MTLRRSQLKRSTLKPLRYRRHPVGTRKGLIQSLDDVVSKIVRKRDGQCITCRSTENLTCSHFYSRRFINTRFSLLNTACQCWDCNLRHSITPWAYLNWMLTTYPEGTLQSLHEARFSKVKLSGDDLRALLESLRSELRSMR